MPRNVLFAVADGQVDLQACLKDYWQSGQIPSKMV